jgi:hypothetical protein
VQKRIKDQQWPNADYPPAQKIDITIVVDMLLTGFDSKFLNTLYVDKNLKHHGLIQALPMAGLAGAVGFSFAQALTKVPRLSDMRWACNIRVVNMGCARLGCCS